MHFKSDWPLVFAAVIMCLVVLILVGSKDLGTNDVASSPHYGPNSASLVAFAAAINSDEYQANSVVENQMGDLLLPSLPATTDPVVAVSFDSPYQGEFQELALELEPAEADIDPLSELSIENQSISDGESEPILFLDNGESEGATNPFQVCGPYQSEDFIATQPEVSTGQFLSPSDRRQEVMFDDEEVENSAPGAPLRLASGPARLPYIKRNSEVMRRSRAASQPIREILIPEWEPTAAWPKPTAIVEKLERLEQIPEVAKWAQDTKQLIKFLHWTESTSDVQVVPVFEQMTYQLEKLDQIAVSVSTTPVTQPEYAQGPLATELRTFHYAIARRLMIWAYAHELAKKDLVRFSDISDEQVRQIVFASQSRLNVEGVGSSWSEYLLLADLQAAFNSLQPKIEDQRRAARATLSRLYSPVLSQAQKDFLNQRVDESLINLLREKACDSVELPELMRMLERHEYDSNGYTSHKMNEFYQSLLWSNDLASQNLAGQLDGHYRNANFRVSVSEKLINRLLPQTPDIEQPINENVMGAQVHGNSRIQNRLLIRLIPDNKKVNLWLEANGRVRSLTQARQSGFRIDNVGNSRFQVFKQIAFNRSGVETGVPYAVSDTSSQVVGMQSNLDPIPVVGWVARRIAQNKIRESSPMTDQYTRQKLESGAKEQIESEVQTQLSQVSDYLFVNMLQPLIALELEPTPIEMRTTDERIVMRYRLSGRDQMAAHTARPRALANSLMSVQLHESVFNNLLDRIEISGRSFTAQELNDHLMTVFRSPQAAGSKEMDHDANFEFAPYDPMRIEFRGAQVEISLNLKKFRVGKGKTWKNLNVRVLFNPQVEGSKVVLVRDESGVRLNGANLKFRDQVAVRTVFTALFRDHYEFNAMPEKFGKKFGETPLAISQLVLNDGWLGLSFDDAPRTAGQMNQPQNNSYPQR
ncbi:hypothetical protein OAG68_01160 [bacterium]|nr:hypothetical protein [bacterium]